MTGGSFEGEQGTATRLMVSILRRWLRLRGGDRVLGGSFRGLRLGGMASNRRLAHTFLLGTYEIEIRQQLLRAVGQPGSLRVVNVGAGQGYYAAGLQLCGRGLETIAFESDDDRRRSLGAMLGDNGFGATTDVRGECGARQLEDALEAAPGPTLVLMDIEGGEERLLDASRVHGLLRSAILVEVHEHRLPGLRHDFERRFASTHRIDVIEPRSRDREDLEWSDLVTRCLLCVGGIERLLDEGRPPGDCWMYMVPNRAVPRGPGP